VQGGTRAVEHLRLTLAEVQVAVVRTQVALSAFADFEPSDPTDPDDVPVLAAGAHQAETLMTLVGEVVRWARALEPLRGAPSGDASDGMSPGPTISV
jgi:NAD(P)H-dependent FMN reductase